MMLNQFRILTLAVGIIASALLAGAQTQLNGWPVESQPAYSQQNIVTVQSGDWIVIRSAERTPRELKRDLESAGWSVVAFLPRNGWLARVNDTESAMKFLRSAIVESGKGKAATLAHPVKPPIKIQRDIWEWSRGADASDDLSIVIHYVGDGEGLRELIETSGGEITSEPLSPGKGRLGVKILGKKIAACLESISGHHDVYSVQAGAGARLLNDNAARIVQSGSAAGNVAMWNRGLRGEGQVIAVLDTGLDFDSCYFAEDDGSSPPLALGTAIGAPDPARRKVIIYDLLYSGDWGAGPSDFDNQGHGTAVGGNALGSRVAAPFDNTVNNGVAPAAQIIVQDAGFTGFDNCADLIALQCPVVDLTPFLDQAVAQRAHFHNNSWGDRENFFPQNIYTAPTADLDEAMWRNPEFLIICAAGNSGSSGNDTVGSPSVAKNAISVAAGQSPSAGGNAENIASFSSRGWTSDGRIKPDIAAPGQTSSARSDSSILTDNCSAQLIQGTSMSSPVTAASAALVRQYFIDGWHPGGVKDISDGFVPTAALIKAVLFNGGDNMSGVAGAPPNRAEGWGRVNLENSLYFAGDARRLLTVDARDYFSSPSLWTKSIMASGNDAAGDVKISLVWTDYPASPAASPALVNDLDLIVRVADTGEEYRGNQLDAVTGLSVIGGAADQINNVEMVVLPGSISGELEIRVEASLIVEGPQGFALVVSGDVAEIETSAARDWWFYIR